MLKHINSKFMMVAAGSAVSVAMHLGDAFLMRASIPEEAQDVTVVQTGQHGRDEYRYKNAQGQDCRKQSVFFELCR